MCGRDLPFKVEKRKAPLRYCEARLETAREVGAARRALFHYIGHLLVLISLSQSILFFYLRRKPAGL